MTKERTVIYLKEGIILREQEEKGIWSVKVFYGGNEIKTFTRHFESREKADFRLNEVGFAINLLLVKQDSLEEDSEE